MSSPVKRVWSKDKERRWRKTFTKENILGDKKLRYRLRHETADQVSRSFKAEHMAQEAAQDEQARVDMRAQFAQAEMSPTAAKPTYVSRGTKWTADEARRWRETAAKAWKRLCCFWGVHEWQDRHKMIMNRAYGMETACRHCNRLKQS